MTDEERIELSGGLEFLATIDGNGSPEDHLIAALARECLSQKKLIQLQAEQIRENWEGQLNREEQSSTVTLDPQGSVWPRGGRKRAVKK